MAFEAAGERRGGKTRGTSWFAEDAAPAEAAKTDGDEIAVFVMKEIGGREQPARK